MAKKKENNVMDVVNGIFKAIHNSHDGAVDKDGEPVKVGLKREEGNIMLDKRVIDGFNVKISANKLIVNYEGEIQIKQVHDKKFEQEIEDIIENVVKFIKKEYKTQVGSALSLSEIKEHPVHVAVRCISGKRCWVEAFKMYKIGGLDEPKEQSIDDDPNKGAIRKWLENFKEPKKPENITRKEEKKDKE